MQQEVGDCSHGNHVLIVLLWFVKCTMNKDDDFWACYNKFSGVDPHTTDNRGPLSSYTTNAGPPPPPDHIWGDTRSVSILG